MSDAEPRPPRRPRARGGVTMAEVGRLAGVTQATVSRALSEPSKVSAETLARVRDAIEATGYVPNALAGALASQRSHLITALVPSITNIVYSSLLHGFSEIMRPEGYQIMLSETGFDPTAEQAAIAAHLSRRPDGMLLTGIHHSTGSRRLLLSAGVPVVELWDITETPIDRCIGFSHAEVGRAAAEYAVSRGHDQAATIAAGDERAERRQAAFVDRFAALTGRPPVAVDLPRGTATIEMGRASVAQLHERGLPPRLIVFCSSDVIAHGALIEAHARGLSVPGHLAVIGFGDQDFAAHTRPALTTIRVDRDRMGRLAAQALLARFQGGPDGPTVVDVGFEIVVRQTA